ncbi:MAG: BrnT family toxin [Armatimonadota bacterium]|nr:BrnT family toxin [Armatimonadota bacterium]
MPAIRVRHIIWQDHIVEKIQSKHGIEPEEVESALLNRDTEPYIWKAGTDRYAGIARVEDSGEYVFVVFATSEPETVRVITARPATDRERYRFRRRKGLQR